MGTALRQLLLRTFVERPLLQSDSVPSTSRPLVGQAGVAFNDDLFELVCVALDGSKNLPLCAHCKRVAAQLPEKRCSACRARGVASFAWHSV